MARKIRILITDDHALFREALHLMLEAEQDLEVVGQAQDAREALNRVAELLPDIVLMDISMPGLSSIEATQQIKRLYPQIHVLFITMHEDQEYILRCLQVGAAGYVLKDTPSSQLVSAIREVMRGGQYISPLALKKVMVDYLGRGRSLKIATISSYETLTAREKEILKLLAEGLSNKEVAVKLNISVKTADVHKSNLMRKLNIHDRSSLIKYAVRNKLVQFGHY